MSHDHGVGAEGCKKIFARLSEYLDEQLDPAVCTKLNAHMDDCVPCRAFLESLRRTVSALRETEPLRLPDDLREEILESYRRLRDAENE